MFLKKHWWVIALIAVVIMAFFLKIDENSVDVSKDTPGNISSEDKVVLASKSKSTRSIKFVEKFKLPVSGSVSETDISYTIPLEEIRRGCFRQDCIPSVDDPLFIPIKQADSILSDEMIGIGLKYKGESRFYSFAMLVTRELVNDIVAGDPLLISYCPLCGTGIVFDRTLNEKVYEFGVSGMLWQSNLLMYNRADDIEERNLWSQVLGEAIAGDLAGEKLQIIPSDIMRYGIWKKENPEGVVLNTGSTVDPYNGQYYQVALNFKPDFDEKNTLLDPSAYVYGISIDGITKAYPRSSLPVGVTNDTVNGVNITITKDEIDKVIIKTEDGEVLPDVEGFWFSWIAAYPESELWDE